MAAKTCPQCGSEYDLDQIFCSKDGATLLSSAAPDDDLVGHVFGGKYRITRRLGGGGMGDVYLAEHVRLKKPTAVKVIRSNLVEHADAVARFNREAQNASMINHACVASVYDFGETGDGMVFLAMEFVDGQPLSEIIKAGPLSPTRAGNILRQVCDALTAAHRMGIVHRDLKPDNIMIARHHDGTDLVKLVDFGISKLAGGEDQNITATGSTIGTPAYMSPEQVRSVTFDGRSDIYSMGLVLFQMLSGRLPFDGDTPQSQMVSRLIVPPQTLRQARSDVAWPAEVESVIARALALEPENRYQTAMEFAGAFLEAAPAMSASAATVLLPDQRAGVATTVPERVGTGGGQSRHRAGGPMRLVAALSVIVVAGLGGGVLIMQWKSAPVSAPPEQQASRGTSADSTSQRQSAPADTNSSGAEAATKAAGTQVPQPTVAQLREAQPRGRESRGAGSIAPTDAGRDQQQSRESLARDRDSTVQAGTPAQKPTDNAPTPDALSAQLDDDIRALAAGLRKEDIRDDDLLESVRRARDLLSRARTSGDTIRILYSQSEAYALLGDRSSACRALAQIRPLATAPPYSSVIAGTQQRLGCP